MSGPPHHPHNRQVPSGGSPWNHHLQVPNYFARQPQLAHMSSTNDAHHTPLIHQPTWHTPTTNDPPPPTIKPPPAPHSTLFDVMSNITAAELFLRQNSAPSTATVDLSVTRNGSGAANGEMGGTGHAPISLSVRDTNKINSLPASVLQDIQAIELTKPSHVAKSISPGLDVSKKRTNIRVDSILERLNPSSDAKESKSDFGGTSTTNFGGTALSFSGSGTNFGTLGSTTLGLGTTLTGSTSTSSSTNISTATNLSNMSSTINSNDENSNSSSTTNNTAVLLEDGASNFSNDDSLDGNKSRRKRKPNKTVRVPNTEGGTADKSDKITASSTDSNCDKSESVGKEAKSDSRSSDSKGSTENAKSSTDSDSTDKNVVNTDKSDVNSDSGKLDGDLIASEGSTVSEVLSRTRRKGTVSTVDSEPSRKSSSDSETIDNIAAMVEGLKSSTDGTTIGTTAINTSENCLNNTKDINDAKDNNKDPKKRGRGSTKNGTTSNTNPKANSPDNKESPKVPKSNSPKNSCTNPKDSSTAPGTTKPPLESENRPQLGLIRVKDDLMPPKSTTLLTAAQRKVISTEPFSTSSTANTSSSTDSSFVDVENKLEEMFAGIEDLCDKSDAGHKDESVGSTGGTTEDSLLKLDESLPSTSQAVLSSTPTPSAFSAAPNKSDNPENSTRMSNSNAKNPLQKKKRKPQKNSTPPSNPAPIDEDSASPTKRRRLSHSSTSPSKKAPNSKSNATAQKGAPLKGGAINSAQKASAKGGASVQRSPSMGVKTVKKERTSSAPKIDRDVYAYDSGSNASSSRSRGPFIQIRGPRDSPLSVQVVNTPTMEDEEKERRKAGKNKKFHDDSEYRHKVRSKGLHCSTLSNKYDAQTRDATWICAFCKKGPHDRSLSPSGDLFGPYFITTDCPEYEKRLHDPYDVQFKSKKVRRSVEALPGATPNKKGGRKSDEDILLGITETVNKTYEVWAHEDCIVWSPGTYLIGPKIVGLEEAVWTCCNVVCKYCGHKGANICCLRRGCTAVMHVNCARANDWCFDEVSFKAFCPAHAPPSATF